MLLCDSTNLRPYKTVDTVEMTTSHSTNETEPETRSTKAEETTYHIQEDESVTEAVVRAVCSVTESDQMGLEPIYSVVDPDALNVLFGSGSDPSRRTDGVVAFEYVGRHVRITSENTVKVSGTPPDENVPNRV